MKKTSNTTTNVALYIRVSTDRQAKEGDSLEAQEKALKDYAKQHNYIIVDIYVDGGESGQKLKRTNLQRMLKDVEDGKIDLVIMTKLDRWFRNVSDFYKVLEVLKRNKVNWKTIWEDYDTTTASGEFWLNMSLALGQMEAQRTGERINEVFSYKFKVQKTVCSGAKIFGYDISNDKKLIINEEEANQLNQLYDKYIETNNLSETVRWFQNNIKTISYDSIKLYLKNTAYIGKYKHINKKTKEIEIIEGFSPPIIDIDKFNKVQEMFKTNVKKHTGTSETGNKTDYIFNRFIYCKCGRKLAGKHSKGKHYYICKNSLTSLCDNHIHISELNLEKYLLENITSYVSMELKKMQLDSIADVETQKNNVNNIAKLKKKLDKLTTLYLEDIVDIDFYKKEYSSLKEQLDELEKQKKNDKPKDFTKLKEFLESDWLILYKTLENKEKREFWMSIIDSIIFNSKEDFKINFKLY